MAEEAKSLGDALEAFKPEGPHFGESEGPVRKARDSAERLRRDLHNVSTRNQRYFHICFASLLVLFAGACVIVIAFRDRPRDMAAIFGATGISIIALVMLKT